MTAHGGAAPAGGGHGGGWGFFPFFPWWGFGFPSPYRPCIKCGVQIPRVAKFCPWCRAPQGGAPLSNTLCPECSGATVLGAPYCPHCSAPIPSTDCKSCDAPLPPQAKYCPECGTKVP